MESLDRVFSQKKWVRYVIVTVLSTAVYFRGLFGGLLLSWDDDRFIVDSGLTNNVSLDSLFSIFSQQHFEAYHPLHLLSYWLDVPWFGHGGPAIHMVSLILWIIVLFCLVRLFDILGLSKSASLLAALLFGLHPIQVEVVTWATGRKDILAALFSFLTIIAYTKSQKALDRYAWLSRCGYIFAALSKTTTITLPGVLFLYDVLIKRKKITSSLLSQLPMLVIGIGLSAIVVLIWDENTMIRPNVIASVPTRFAASVTHHFLTALAPFNTAAVYPVNRASDFTFTAYLVPAGLLVFAAVSIWKCWRMATFSILCFIILLLPVSNIIPMYWHWMDRYLSLPLFSLSFGIGLAITKIGNSHKKLSVLLASAAVLFLISISIRTAVHHMRYTDDLLLWKHAVECQPEAFHAWKKYGERLIERKRPDEAIESFKKALEIEPFDKIANANLLQSYSLKDEIALGLQPSRIETIGVKYMKIADNPYEIKKFAALMERTGYRLGTVFLLERYVELMGTTPKQMIFEAMESRRMRLPVSNEFYLKKSKGDS